MEKLQNLRSVLKEMSGEVIRELKEIWLTKYIKNQPKIN